MAKKQPTFSPGPNLTALEQLAATERNVETGIVLMGGESRRAEVSVFSWRSGMQAWTCELSPDTDDHPKQEYDKSSLTQAMRVLFERHPTATIQLSSVWVKVNYRATNAHKDVAIRAWCEAFERTVPDDEQLKNAKKVEDIETKKRSREMIALLQTGADGVAEWNQQSEVEKRGWILDKADLSDVELRGLKLGVVSLKDANLSGADLAGADLSSCNLSKSNLHKANLERAILNGTNLTKADLREASIPNAKLLSANLREAKLDGADLSGSHLDGANLRAVDLSTTKLSGTVLTVAKYDSKTKFPPGFTQYNLMKWMESTPAPRGPAVKKVLTPTESLAFEEFMEKLPKVCRAGKIDNAVRMLKAERFELYAQVEEDGIVGVVRSQSSSSRVYACHLSADGSYSCGTQNLRACGGLQGSPCKHLLVLLIGLAKSDKLDCGLAHDWIKSASRQQPTWDKDDASEIFLKYKGAEAGEVDWRPTETIPEDFYAL